MSKEIEAIDRAIAAIETLQSALVEVANALDRFERPTIEMHNVYTVTGEAIPVRGFAPPRWGQGFITITEGDGSKFTPPVRLG